MAIGKWTKCTCSYGPTGQILGLIDIYANVCGTIVRDDCMGELVVTQLRTTY